MSIYTLRPLDDLTMFTATKRKPSIFSANWSTTLQDLARELRLVHATDVVLEVAVTAADIRKDGQLRADAKPFHPGVRLSFQTSEHGVVEVTCDTYTAWQANVRAIVLTLDAMRAMDRYGASQGKQYRGFAALPAGSSGAADGDADDFVRMPPVRSMTRLEALGVLGEYGSSLGRIPAEHVDTSSESLHRMVRRARRRVHPDRQDGDRTAWDEVEQAAKVLGLSR